ncbi:MAG: hypothetical protein P1U39_02170 [Legionellaceae bacterium]|nr:hypothetical protein [Legionellaceae bacterium]
MKTLQQWLDFLYKLSEEERSKIVNTRDPNEGVMGLVLETIKTPADLMAFCAAIPEKKDYLMQQVFNEYRPFEHVLPGIAREINTASELMELCAIIPEKKDYFMRQVFNEYRPFEHVLPGIAREINTASELMELCAIIPEKKDYFMRQVFNEYRPFEHVLPGIAREINTASELMELCDTIPEKKDYFIRQVFNEYRPFAHVLPGIAKEIKTAPQLMELCDTIPEKKDYFIRQVFNEYRPFAHVLPGIANEINTASELMELCAIIPEKKDYLMQQVFDGHSYSPFKHVLSSITKKLTTEDELMALVEYAPEKECGKLIEMLLVENTPLCEQILHNFDIDRVNEVSKLHRDMIFEISAGLGRIDIIEVIAESCDEQELQALISRAYHHASNHGNIELLTYLEGRASPGKLKEMIESVLFASFLKAAKNSDAVVIQHFLEFPVARKFAEGYGIGHVELPGFKWNFIPQFSSPEQQFIREQLLIVHGVEEECLSSVNQGQDSKTIRAQYIRVLKKHLLTIADERIKQNPADSKWINFIQPNLFRLLNEYGDEKIALERLAEDSQRSLEMCEQFIEDITITKWIDEHISTALRAFFHACDKLQAIFTGEMIDKPERQMFFSKSSREKSIEAVQNISEEFFEKINELKEKIENLDSPDDLSETPSNAL